MSQHIVVAMSAMLLTCASHMRQSVATFVFFNTNEIRTPQNQRKNETQANGQMAVVRRCPKGRG